ncbi:MAG: antibiotic biosynthesis monooxygenase [Pseudomonadota bacterium]
MIAVCVTLTVHAGRRAAFLDLLRAHGSRCLALEPGCARFDICSGGGDTLFIYELYADHAAYRAHLGSAHFIAFDAEAGPMVARKDVAVWDQVDVRMPQTDN